MRKWSPILFGKKLHQIPLDLFGVRSLGQPQTAGDSLDVSVDNDTRSVECAAENNISGFPSHSGEFQQFAHGFGDFPAKVPFDYLSTTQNGPRLGAKEAR